VGFGLRERERLADVPGQKTSGDIVYKVPPWYIGELALLGVHALGGRVALLRGSSSAPPFPRCAGITTTAADFEAATSTLPAARV